MEVEKFLDFFFFRIMKIDRWRKLTFIPMEIAWGITSHLKSLAVGKFSVRSFVITCLLITYIPMLGKVVMSEFCSWKTKCRFISRCRKMNLLYTIKVSGFFTWLFCGWSTNSTTRFLESILNEPNPGSWFLLLLWTATVISASLSLWALISFW